MVVVLVVFNDYQMVTNNDISRNKRRCVKVDDKDEQWFPSGKGAETEILVSEIRREPVALSPLPRHCAGEPEIK